MALTHVTPDGQARMVDVGAKPIMHRQAVAGGKIFLRPDTLKLIRENGIQKGDVLAVARVAGISGGKKTAELIPLCHNIPIDRIDLDISLRSDHVEIIARASCQARTGIEMEALTAATVAALTIYDMCKAVDHEMVIGEIRLLEKTKS